MKVFSRLKNVSLWFMQEFVGTWLSIVLGIALFGGVSAYAAVTTYQAYNIEPMGVMFPFSATATNNIRLTALKRNGVAVDFPALSGGVLEFRQNTNVEQVYYSRAIVNPLNKMVTLTGTIIRNLDWNVCNDYVSLGDGKRFTPGTEVRFVDDCRLYNRAVKTDRLSTTQGSGGLLCGSTTQPCLFLGSYTTAQRDAFTFGNDLPGIIYNSTLGVFQGRSGGSWQTFAAGTGTIVNATELVEGKVILASTGTMLAQTANAPSGAAYVIWNKYLTQSGGTLMAGRVPNLGTLGTLSARMGGLGRNNPQSGGLLAGQGPAAARVIVPGISGSILKSDGSRWNVVSGSGTTTNSTFYVNGNASTSTGGVTSGFQTFYYDTHIFTIPANTLIAGVGYEITGIYYPDINGNAPFFPCFRLGTTDTLTTLAVNANDLRFKTNIRLFGTAAAGGSVAVRYDVNIAPETVVKTNTGFLMDTGSFNAATNGDLTFRFCSRFSAGSGLAGNGNTVSNVMIRKVSDTPFFK